MAFFGVTVEKIERVWEHKNADRLSLATMTGLAFQFVILKEQFVPGDKVIYFPVDSLLPSAVVDQLGLTGKLAGADANRIKSVRLRGEISMGIVCRPETVGLDSAVLNFGDNVTETLGVIKYEPPLPQDEQLLPMPSYVSKYDIEAADRFVDIADSMLDVVVYITEKLEGRNWGVTFNGDETQFFQRNNGIVMTGASNEHDFISTAYKTGLMAKIDALREYLGNPLILTARGEIVGPNLQGNHYRLTDKQIYLFDIEVNKVVLPSYTFFELTKRFDITTVPLLFDGGTLREFLGGNTIQAASNGKSMLNPHVAREGIVIKPAAETFDLNIGRLFLKQRSPDYLVGTDN